MLTKIKIISPKTSDEFKIYYDIRFTELRKPWGQPIGSEKDSLENECIHRMLTSASEYIGVARLQFNKTSQAQIRYMAIKKEYQRQGYGKLLIDDMEKNAKENGASEIILESREQAIKFYQKLNYKLEKKTHLLFDEIQHFLMKKYL